MKLAWIVAIAATPGISALIIACGPRTHEARSPAGEPVATTSPTTPASPAPVPTPATTPVTDAVHPPVVGPALTPWGLTFPPGWPVTLPPWAIPGAPGGLPSWPAMPTGLPFPLPPLPVPAPTSTPAPTPAPKPAPAPPTATDAWPSTWSTMEDEVLVQVNLRRAAGAVCGGKPYGAAKPLGNEAALRASARGHSRDMATKAYFDHTGLDGSSPFDRMKAAGWPDKTYMGENIAAGRATASDTVQQWMDSPGHCVNIMNGDFQFMGVGYWYQADSKYKHYWTQNFGGK